MSRIRNGVKVTSEDLDREAVLIQPGALTGPKDEFGQATPAAPVRHAAFAQKLDLYGREAIAQGVDASTLRTMFRFDYGSFPDLDAAWKIEYKGEEYEIIAPPTELGREAFWEVVAVRRKGGT